MARKTETDIADGVMRVAAQRNDGLASFRRCRQEMPGFMGFSADDNAMSGTRPGETMWHQQVRNIRSHHAVPGSAIHDGLLEHVRRVGYRITQAGRDYLRRKGIHP